MALTMPEALKAMAGGGDPLMGAIAKTVVTVDAFAAAIPFIETTQPFAPVDREGDEPTGGGFLADTGAGPIESSTGTDDRVAVPLRRIVGDMDVDALVDDLSGGSQRARHLQKKFKATWRGVCTKMVTGGNTTSHTIPGALGSLAAVLSATYSAWLDSTRNGPGSIKYVHATQTWYFRAPRDREYGAGVVATVDGNYTLKSANKSYFIVANIDVSVAVANAEGSIYFATSTNEFDGLAKICVPAQTIDPVAVDGDLFSLSLLDKMISNLKVEANPSFIFSSSYIELFYRLLREQNGTAPETVMLAGYGRPVPTYRGYPILRNDNVPNTETVGGTTDAGSLYLASLSADEGLALAVANLGQRFDPTADPSRGPVLGWRVENLGALEGSDHRRTRVAWYGAPVLKSPLALVRKRGVKLAVA